MDNNFLSFLKNPFSSLTNLISPPTCVGCHEFLPERIPLCQTCEATVKPVLSHEVVVTEKYMMRVFALGEYEGVIRSLIVAKQFGARLPSRQLGQLMAQRCLCDWQNVDCLVPVPLHWRRYAVRGFNQTEEIAKVLAREHGVLIACGVQRVRATKYQASLEQQERRANVHKVFEVKEGYKALYKDKHVMLVDDLMTTGSTLIEVAKAVAACRPASISAVVAARVVLK